MTEVWFFSELLSFEVNLFISLRRLFDHLLFFFLFHYSSIRCSKVGIPYVTFFQLKFLEFA